MKERIIAILKLFPQTFRDYKDKNPLQLAASTAFLSLFAIPPILVILVTTLGLFLKPEYLSDEIFARLSDMLGSTGTEELKNIFNNFQGLAEETWSSIVMFVFLIFVATNLFFLMQMNIDQLWEVPSRSKQHLKKHLTERLWSFALVLIGGVIILLAILSDAIVAFLGNQIEQIFPFLRTPLVQTISIAFSIITYTAWFTLLFKILPSAKPAWKPVFLGGMLCAILFLVGQKVIELLLLNSNVKSVFGASSSIVLVMLFVFYVSFIFYFVASFVKNYASSIGKPVANSLN